MGKCCKDDNKKNCQHICTNIPLVKHQKVQIILLVKYKNMEKL